jgi:4-hydroxy-tetrahydrodipicolinate synthase
VIKTVVDCNDGRLPLVLGVGGNDTRKMLKNYKLDFSSLLQYSPFLHFTTNLLKKEYTNILKRFQASPIPIIIYNVPGRTSSNMLPKTVLRLANDFQNIVAVKEAAGIWFKLCK